MPMIHYQTYQTTPKNGAVKTNWSIYGNANVWPQTSYSTFSPKVGSYLLNVNIDNAAYVQYTNNITIDWSTYTVEGWVCMPTQNVSWTSNRYLSIGPLSDNTQNMRIVVQPNNPTNQMIVSSGVWNPNASSVYGIGSGLIPAAAWTYFAYVKYSNSLRALFINGQQVNQMTTTFTEPINTTTAGNAVTIGNTDGSGQGPVTIWDQIRISNIPRYGYNSTFTPPTTAFVNDDNTWYLCSFENTLAPAPSPT